MGVVVSYKFCLIIDITAIIFNVIQMHEIIISHAKIKLHRVGRLDCSAQLKCEEGGISVGALDLFYEILTQVCEKSDPVSNIKFKAFRYPLRIDIRVPHQRRCEKGILLLSTYDFKIIRGLPGCIDPVYPNLLTSCVSIATLVRSILIT